MNGPKRFEDVWMNVELLRDGSYRWLWQVCNASGVFTAGIAMSATDAQAQARQALQRYADMQASGQAEQVNQQALKWLETHTLTSPSAGPPKKAAEPTQAGVPMCNFDEVDRGSGDQEDQPPGT